MNAGKNNVFRETGVCHDRRETNTQREKKLRLIVKIKVEIVDEITTILYLGAVECRNGSINSEIRDRTEQRGRAIRELGSRDMSLEVNKFMKQHNLTNFNIRE